MVTATAYLQYSDIRLKTNVQDILNAIEIVSQLKGKTYQWKNGEQSDTDGGRRVIGMIAQEVQKVLPEV